MTGEISDVKDRSPAFLNVVAGLEYLKEALRTSFVINHRAIGFCKCSCRYNDSCFLNCCVGQAIKYNHLFALRKDLISKFFPAMAIQVILHDDHRISMSVSHRIKRRVKTPATHQGKSHRITL